MPTRNVGLGRAGRGLLLAALLGGVPLTSSVAPATAASLLLPDIQMAAPYNLYVQSRKDGRKLLRFGTIVWNVGDGPLEVRARHRAGREMTTIVQRIRKAGGRYIARRPTGARVYYSGDGHTHWHIERFIEVTLAPPPGDAAPITSESRLMRKLGFCLVDLVRAPASLRPPNSSLDRAYGVSGCGGRDSPTLRMGISVGWGDDYKPFFNHQLIDISGLPAATYRLCATVNPEGTWREKDDNTANNSYWLDLSLDPQANTLQILAAGLSSCDTPSPPIS